MSPLFSIGVTTYNRNDLLRECLNSILQQEFTDFEIIIGNDYTHQKISFDDLGIYDPRIRIVNYPKNIGPVENANTLLALSNGRYFTLLADDDMHTDHFLQAMYNSIIKYNHPSCIFSSFTSDIETANNLKNTHIDIVSESKLFTGPQFLNKYLSRALVTIGCYGVFEIGYLRGVGGISSLGSGRSMYAEMPLVIASGLLEKVVYLHHPIVFFRSHPGSLSNTSTDVASYADSQKALFVKCFDIFNKKEIRECFQENVFLLLKWCIQDVVTVMHRSGSIPYEVAIQYIIFVKQVIGRLKYSIYYWKSICVMIKVPMAGLLAALYGKCGALFRKFFCRKPSLA